MHFIKQKLPKNVFIHLECTVYLTYLVLVSRYCNIMTSLKFAAGDNELAEVDGLKNGVILTLGMLSWLHNPSASRRSRISQAKIDGHSRLYCEIRDTTQAVATRGLLPPIARGRIEPVS